MSTERIASKIRELKGTKNKREYITNEEIVPIQRGLLFVEDENLAEKLGIVYSSGFLCHYRVVRDPESPHDPRIYIHTNINMRDEELNDELKAAVVNPFAGRFNEPVYAVPAYYDSHGQLVMQVRHLDDTHPGLNDEITKSSAYSRLQKLLSDISQDHSKQDTD